MTKQTEEQFIKDKGWKQYDGVKVDHSGFADQFEFTFWHKDDIKDFITECTFWEHPTEDGSYETAEEVIEAYYDDEWVDDNE